MFPSSIIDFFLRSGYKITANAINRNRKFVGIRKKIAIFTVATAPLMFNKIAIGFSYVFLFSSIFGHIICNASLVAISMTIICFKVSSKWHLAQWRKWKIRLTFDTRAEFLCAYIPRLKKGKNSTEITKNKNKKLHFCVFFRVRRSSSTHKYASMKLIKLW